MENNLATMYSEHLLEAMLYVLRDPTLDCEAYELELANDPQLGDFLAEAVEILQRIERSKSVLAKLDIGTVRICNSEVASVHSWKWLAALAASLVVIFGFGWNAWVNESEDRLSFASVVHAWTDLQSDDSDSDDLRLRLVGFAEGEPTDLNMDYSDVDVPDWLISATVVNATMTIAEAVQ